MRVETRLAEPQWRAEETRDVQKIYNLYARGDLEKTFGGIRWERFEDRRAAFASHRVVGWIFWDPEAIANYAALGVPDGTGYYIASRAAPLASAGDQAVTAAFGSIHGGFVRFALELCRQHTTFEAAADLYRSARRAGFTVRSSTDCLIAACALRHDLEVLHRDRDFPALASVSALRVRRA